MIEIIGSDAERHGSVTENTECAIDRGVPAAMILIEDRRVLAELARTCGQDQHAVGFYMGPLGYLVAEANHRRIGARRDDELRLQVVPGNGVNQIDARIDV